MTRLSALFLLCASLISLPALAQIGGGYGGSSNGGGYGPGTGTSPNLSRAGQGTHGDDDDAAKSKEDKPVAPPPAIPGAQPDSDAAVIPADKLAAEMSPNDALFDAINRGDLAAAKDALSRGAQLDAHNVLGQTPTDAAIDLSRNDITFLLLSMRTALPSAHTVATVADPLKPEKAKHKKLLAQAAQRTPLPADRGTPNPSVGFIGF
jgi:hypothetical protein